MKKLLFDARIINNGIYKNSSRSGIYFTALNILKNFIKRKDIDITLLCNSSIKDSIEKILIENGINNAKFLYLDANSSKLVRLYDKYKDNQIKAENQNQKFKTLFYKIIILFIKPLKSIGKNHYLNIKSYDYYFSPAFRVPKEIEKIDRIKKFVFLHDIMPILFPQYYSHWGKNNWHAPLCRKLNSKDFYFTNSECTRLDFLKYFPVIDPNKIFTTYLACSEDFRQCNKDEIQKTKNKYNIPSDKKYIFSLCTLEPRKNLIRAVKTFVKFIEKNNIEDFVFVLGGAHWNSFIDQIKKEIKSINKFKNNIIYAGYIDDEDLAPLYSGAEWFVYTSQYEGFGLPPLEAMACGCPVITSNNSSLPEVVGDSAITIDWDSDEQHINAYEKYYFDNDFRNKMAQKGLERSKQFSWEKCVNIIIEKMEQSNKK